uniref:ABC transporter domain-containing protein n=1 Tax=Hanusia phi TaxID=3032 RepID=A0A7S0EUT3_9CRYP
MNAQLAGGLGFADAASYTIPVSPEAPSMPPIQPMQQINPTPQPTKEQKIELLKGHSVADTFAYSTLQINPVTLSWRDLTYDVKLKRKNPETGQSEVIDKRILDGLSGVVRPGEMLAICGPSGGGKTTLLDAIAGRIDPNRKGRTFSGDVLVNGKVRDDTFSLVASYVQQEYALQTPFTVKETMAYAADLLIPHSESTREERRMRAENVTHVLGLDSCSNTIVGDVFRKGLSGGQLRRLSIAVELVRNPSILLLDEPTSGLDSAAAENIMQHLSHLAKMGTTVVCTIHQPPSEVWANFDKFLLLSKGKCLYFGTASTTVDYFGRMGYPCPGQSNPADFFLRLANTDFEGHADIEALSSGFKTQPEGMALVAGVAAPITHEVHPHKKTNGFLIQLMILSHRAFFNNARNPGIFLVRLVMYAMLCAIIGFMFWNLQLGPSDINSRITMLFFVAAFLTFMSVAVLPFFIVERAVFLRERANGWYVVPAYVLATFFMSLPGLFMIALLSTILVVLPSGLTGFGIFLLDLFLALMAAEAFMSVVASVVPHYIIGIALGAAVYGFFMLCEGFMKIRDDIPDYFIWGYYIAFHTYSFRAFMVNEFENIDYFVNSPQFGDGQAVLRFYNMENKPVWKDLLIVLGYALGLQLIFGTILQVFHKGKR